MREIRICPCVNGWLVKVGCQFVVFTNLRTMAEEIIKYISDPKTVEQEYLDNSPNPVIQRSLAATPIPSENPGYMDRNQVMNELLEEVPGPAPQREGTDGTPVSWRSINEGYTTQDIGETE